ncbi:MAG: M20/M25/M40 family metallo-hydrolase [Tepidisphaeraceae bacterium]
MAGSARVRALILAALPLATLACSSKGLPVTAIGPGMKTTTVASDPALAAIRDEGLNRSKISETAEYLCNVIGPRLTASPALQQANLWTRDTLTNWGLSDARLEPWGPFGRGWLLDEFSFRVTQPYTYMPVAYPKAWSPGLDKPLDAKIVYLDTKTEAGLNAYKDKVKGAIVLIGQPKALPADFEPDAKRLTDERLTQLGNLPLNTKRATLDLIQSATDAADADNPKPWPTSGPAAIAEKPAAAPTATAAASAPTTRRRPTTRRAAPAAATDLAAASFAQKALTFAAKNGAACVVTPSATGDGGTVFVTQAMLADTTPRKGPNGATTQPRVWWPDSDVLPQIMVSIEDFNRLASLARHDVPTQATVDLKARYTPGFPQQYNTVADLPGTDKADEIVMIGGHLDSWHAGTGATDNAAGAVVAMEAVRLIKASGLKPRRTIRVALWTGEEQGLHGSSAYVRQHFGEIPKDDATTQPATAAAATEPSATAPLSVENIAATQPAAKPVTVNKVGPEYDKFVVYFNLDNGTGRIRGIYGENNVPAIKLFKQWVEPLKDLGCTTVTTDTTGSTDHVVFNRIGLPGFQFIQDPVEYFPRTHHSNADTFERLQIDDLKQASVVMATFLWNAANMDEPFPRKAIGK